MHLCLPWVPPPAAAAVCHRAKLAAQSLGAWRGVSVWCSEWVSEHCLWLLCWLSQVFSLSRSLSGAITMCWGKSLPQTTTVLMHEWIWSPTSIPILRSERTAGDPNTHRGVHTRKGKFVTHEYCGFSLLLAKTTIGCNCPLWVAAGQEGSPQVATCFVSTPQLARASIRLAVSAGSVFSLGRHSWGRGL